MKNGKEGWWKRFCGFRKSKKKGKEPSNRMDEISSLTDSEEKSGLDPYAVLQYNDMVDKKNRLAGFFGD